MRRGLKGLSLYALLAAGCYVGAYYDPYYYDSAYYGPYWYGYDGAMTYSWVDENGVIHYTTAPTGLSDGAQRTSVDVDATAEAIAAAANRYFAPAGCAHATASGATVTYAFSGCSGPQGLGSVDGNMTVTLSDHAGALVLTASSTDLRVNGSPFIVDSVSSVEQVGEQMKVSVSSRSRAPDLVDAREAQLTVSWKQGSGCIVVDGQGTPQRGELVATTALTGFQTCKGRCPTSGSMTVTSSDGAFTGTFDGSSTLKVTGPNGDTREFQLNCY